MQSIIRENTYQGTNPANGSTGDYPNAEIAFIRMSSLYSQYYQHYIAQSYSGYSKLTKHFFVDADVCYGYKAAGYTIQTGLQTAIFLNCKFKGNGNLPDYNNSNAQIHIETIDDSCKEFTSSEKASGRSVTELTIKVLCEQLKPINIPETEKTELINGFIQRRGLQNEDVLGEMGAAGWDYIDFAQKKGMNNDQVLVALIKSGVDCSDFMQKKGLNNDQVLNVVVKQQTNISGFVQKKGISVDQVTAAMINQNVANDSAIITLIKSKLDTTILSQKKGITDDEILNICIKSNLDFDQFTQSKGISSEQVLVALTKNGADTSSFILNKGMTNDQILTVFANNGIDVQDFIQKKGISNDQVIISLAKNFVDCSDFAQKKGISNDQVLITLAKNGVDVSDFAQKNGISNDQVLLFLMKNNLDYVGFALRRGMKDEQVLTAFMKNNLDYNSFAISKSISNDQILVALVKSGLDFQTFAQSKGFTDEQVLITLMKAKVDIQPFTTTKNMSSANQIEIIQNSDLPLLDKYELLQQISPVDLRSEQENINNALIKREYEITNERVLKFMNNKQRELILEIVFKEALLEQKKTQDDSAVNEINDLKLKNLELQKQIVEKKLEYEQQIADIKTGYTTELIKCKNEIEAQTKEFQQNLQLEQDKYKAEIEELKKTIQTEMLNENKLVELQKNKRVSDAEIDKNDTIANQLRMECTILQQQLIDEKQFHDSQQELTQQQLKLITLRNTDLQKQLSDEKKQRIIFFEQLEKKQSEITKQLESTVREQATRIVHLENENQTLQNTLSVLKQQIEKLNVLEYQKRIELQNKQLEDKDQYIINLKKEMDKINVNQLQDKQIEKVLNILKSVSQ
ncbi:obscurin-like_isoform X1 [Hexamita inflata]|uniref:Obscurin-like isoform X1 n=1 Tax=Hexamita inflata TaxID=28002 RepID=A0AA86Q7I9_9EUKA|nr:obscurin-like isoform X1 [Hexamita inflata]